MLASWGEIRRAVGPGILLWVDANQAYNKAGVKRTIQTVAALADAGADIVEQPTEGLAAMAAVAKNSRVPVIADESLWHPLEAPSIADARAADGFSIYVGKSGGISNARSTAVFGGLLGMPYNMNGAFVSGITSAASLQLATAMPSIVLASPCPYRYSQCHRRKCNK